MAGRGSDGLVAPGTDKGWWQAAKNATGTR